MALNDCTGLLTSAKHLEDPKILVKSFETEVRGYLKEQVCSVKAAYCNHWLMLVT